MAVSMDLIKRVVVQGSSEGLAKLESDLRKIAATTDGVSVSFEKASRSQLSAQNAYNRLSSSIDPAEKAQQQLTKGTSTLDKALQQGIINQDDYQKRLGQLKERYNAAGTANDNFVKGTKSARYELINLSRQVQDVGVSLASGQSPFTVLVQQGSQIFDVFASSSLGAKGLLQSITALITPTVVLGAGFAVLVAGGIAAVSMWKNYVTVLDDVSKASGIAFQDLSKLQGAAGVKGISESEFASGITKFAQGINEAKTSTGELYKLFRLNGLTLGDTESTLEKVAELIRRSGDEQQKIRILQQAGLPATAEWVRLLEGGRDGLQKAKAAITGIPADENIKKAKEFDEAVNKIWINAKREIVTFGQSVISAFDDITNSAPYKAFKAVMEFKIPVFGQQQAATINSGVKGLLENSGITNALTAPYNPRLGIYPGSAPTRITVTPGPTPIPNPPLPRARPPEPGVIDTQNYAKQQQELSFIQQRNSLLGEAATVEQLVGAKIKEVNLARILNTEITKENATKIIELYRAQEEYARSAEKLSAFGASATDAERYVVAIEGLSVKLAAGRLSQEEFNRAVAAAHPLFEPLKSAASEFATGFAQDLRNGVNAMDALTNATKRLSDRLIDLALNQSINSLFAKLAGAFGGPNLATAGVGATGPALGQFVTNAYGNAFMGGNVIPFARGGIVNSPTIFPMARGYGLMGEAGPEAVMPLRRGQDGRLGVAAVGGGKMIVNVVNNVGSDVQARPQSQRQNSDGSVSIDVIIERAVRNAVNSDVANNGPMTQGLARRFSLNSAAGIA